MRQRIKGFTLIELLVVIAIIALLISILLPSLSRARELSKRLVCASNIKGVGTSAKIYANENNEKWMIPAFRKAYIQTGIVYTQHPNGPLGGDGQTGFERVFETLSATARYPDVGSTQVAVTRAFWMLVRSGDVTVKQFICPSSGDDEDQTENLDFYCDFLDYTNISYGYQVPFGPRDTQPREGMDNRQVVAADKGPWYLITNVPNWDLSLATKGPVGTITLDHPPKLWRKFNSRNHGGQDNGEGQNCLFADGHATFNRKPTVGIDNDNIYTVMTDDWGPLSFGRIHGDSPSAFGPTAAPYPGRDALGAGDDKHSSTDTLIYP